ncbi:unnamed protein product [Brugia timori]|uniref:AH domain-containing protein n=1 Tax=Brugia timori TaxID=42155 RepID=A0A0R3QUH2_9BILA|nr:unnamed protein product [Brugia timori]
MFICCSIAVYLESRSLVKMMTDNQYMDAAQKFFNAKLKQFKESGGWDVVSEKAQRCTYNRYLEAGTEDCENTARLIESLMVTLKTMKCEMQAEVERLEARQFERTSFTKMVETIDSATKKTKNISESCTNNMNMVDKLVERVDPIIPLPSISIVNLEATTSGLQLIGSSDSRSDQSSACKQIQGKSTRTLVEKLYRPLASLTGSFTVDEDEDTVTFLEPVRVLTFQDTTMDDTVRGKDNLDQISSLKEETVGPIRISEPPVLKSELAKQWIREVAKKTF